MTDKSAIEKMVEYLDNLTAEEWGRQQTPHRIYNEARRLAAEEKSKPAPCEPDGYEKWLESEIGNDVYEKGYRTFLLRARAMYRASKPVPVEAIEGLTEYDKGEMALDQHLAPVEAKATAEGSLAEKLNDILPLGTALCGECGGNGYVLEKSGMGEEQDPIACPYCHGRGLRNISELGYRPASPAVEELVRELREWSIGCHSQDDDGRAERCPGLSKFDQILAKYDNAKGGK